MMRTLITACLLLIFTGSLFGDEKPIIPKEIKLVPGRLLILEATTDAKTFRWKLPPGVDADPACITTRRLVCTAPAGRYILTFLACSETGIIDADCVLIVEPLEPLPPPKPPDPLVGDLRTIYAADGGTDKAENLIKLAAVYSQAASIARLDTVQTASQLADAVRAVSKSLLPADALAGVRKRCGEEISAALADVDPDATLTPETRREAAELYARIAAALESIGGAK